MKQFDVPVNYRSSFIQEIKAYRKQKDRLKKDFSPSVLDFGVVQLYLVRHFGFCYGVENAIEIAFKTINMHPDKKVYLLSEMIHNPLVNQDLLDLGVQFLQDTYGNQLIPFDVVQPDDIVLIPAFGTTLAIEKILAKKGILTKKYNTTCPFVEKVWNRGEQIAQKGYSIILHGKPQHEETRATFSRVSAHTPTLVIKDMEECKLLAQYIKKELPTEQFYIDFKDRYSKGFHVDKDLDRIGVINQTTQLATDTQALADYLKTTLQQYRNLEASETEMYFADTRDTLCYATNDNQSAISNSLNLDIDLAIVIGGYNSSNTSHLVELCEQKFNTYFIDNVDKLLSKESILTCNWRTKEQHQVDGYLPNIHPAKIIITSGASCPDAVVEKVVRRLLSFYNCEDQLAAITQQFIGNNRSEMDATLI